MSSCLCCIRGKWYPQLAATVSGLVIWLECMGAHRLATSEQFCTALHFRAPGVWLKRAESIWDHFLLLVAAALS